MARAPIEIAHPVIEVSPCMVVTESCEDEGMSMFLGGSLPLLGLCLLRNKELIHNHPYAH